MQGVHETATQPSHRLVPGGWISSGAITYQNVREKVGLPLDWFFCSSRNVNAISLMISSLFCLTAAAPQFSKAAEAVFEAGGSNQLIIHADQAQDSINRNIYGHFSEHLGHCIYEGIWVGQNSQIPNTRGIRNDIVAALKRIQIPV